MTGPDELPGLLTRVRQNFDEHGRAALVAVDQLAPVIATAASALLRALLSDRKILVCGNGGSAALAQLFASHLLNHYAIERPGLPAIVLGADVATVTSIANDLHFDSVFSRPLQALGQPGDVLVPISTSGNSTNLIRAVETAHQRDMQVIALIGRDGGDLAQLLQPQDINICVAEQSSPRIQELHLVILHCLCDLIDHQLLGHD